MFRTALASTADLEKEMSMMTTSRVGGTEVRYRLTGQGTVTVLITKGPGTC